MFYDRIVQDYVFLDYVSLHQKKIINSDTKLILKLNKNDIISKLPGVLINDIRINENYNDELKLESLFIAIESIRDDIITIENFKKSIDNKFNYDVYNEINKLIFLPNDFIYSIYKDKNFFEEISFFNNNYEIDIFDQFDTSIKFII